jgi:hypothetical protein
LSTLFTPTIILSGRYPGPHAIRSSSRRVAAISSGDQAIIAVVYQGVLVASNTDHAVISKFDPLRKLIELSV